MRFLPQIFAWLIALAWLTRTLAAVGGLRRIPDLVQPQHDLAPPGAPSVTIVVPGRDEQANVVGCLQSLLAQDYDHLHILAVDDRSTDSTGSLMDSLAGPRLTVLHIAELPPAWLGKTHAMHVAVTHALTAHAPDFLLFTDADILFSPDCIRRAVASAVATSADHLVLAPTTIIRRWDEAALLAFFQIFGLWAARPWKVADAKARDAIGIGAFNLLRTSAYESIGGFAALRMEIVEDLALARRIKLFGLRQRIAFGLGMVRVHWASGVNGIVNVMTKNIFAAVRFHVSLLLIGCAWLVCFCILPWLAVWWRPFTLPAAMVVVSIALSYRLMSRHSGLSTWNVLLTPFAAALFCYALLRSMVVTLWQGGVIWRGTFYSLTELRRNAGPLIPRR